jgi:hypothetical protein
VFVEVVTNEPVTPLPLSLADQVEFDWAVRE